VDLVNCLDISNDKVEMFIAPIKVRYASAVFSALGIEIYEHMVET
jgi:hypothetical protein